MKRYALDELVAWKDSQSRKPLIVYGARQVGKTWLVREFGQTHYKNYLELDFLKHPELADYFTKDLDPHRIIKALEAKFATTITPADTLIFFDEIQECQHAKDSLKYFNDAAKDYHVIAAGSFLGVASGQFPVGQVNTLTLYPMSFYEFLEAAGRQQLLGSIRERDAALLDGLSTLLTDMLRTYFYVGGMPEAVSTFVTHGDLPKVRKVQDEILSAYKSDFSKHINASDIPKVSMLWNSIPVHLAKEKKKFIYKEVKVGGRASEFENAMEWLVNTGLVYKVVKTLTPRIPLDGYQEREVFKLYMLDVGLLCAKTNVDVSSFYKADNAIFSDFQGAMAEQYVLQELKHVCRNPILYWGREKGDSEVDFVMQHKDGVIPIEVKSTRNAQSKSLKVYMDLERPERAIRTSLRNYGVEGNLCSIPLYMIASFADIIHAINTQEAWDKATL